MNCTFPLKTIISPVQSSEKNKELLHVLWCLLLLITTCLSACQSREQNDEKAAPASRPNIIFIMSDDHTTQAFGIYNSRLASLNPTPVLDSLANEGIIFDQAFCTNSICTPSRANIMTGQYSQTNGMLDLDGALPAEKQYLAMEMKKLGYQTAIIGKWHLKEEPAKFDYYEVLPGQGKYFDPEFRKKGEGSWPDNLVSYEGHSSDIITDRTLDWLEKSYSIEQTPAAWEFYDLSKDPQEVHNVYGDPAYKEIIADMKQQLREKREALHETDEKFPHIQKVIEAHWDN